LAFGEKPDGSDRQPAANDRELAVFRRACRHLPPSVFDDGEVIRGNVRRPAQALVRVVTPR